MADLSSSAGVALITGGVVLVLYLTYRAALPRPLPGIPYNKDAASKLLGDVPEMMAYVKRTQLIFCWLTSQTTKHQSPIAQVFIKPMSLPWVVVTDPFESQDILLRRTSDFDRASFFGEVLGGLLPEQHIQFRSDDARFRDNRNLINHLMAPSFINEVSAPEVYNSVCTLMKLWQVKCDTAQGRPFSAHHDITYAALDSIFASSFGLAEADSITAQRLEAASHWTPEIPDDVDTPVDFPDSTIPDIFQAVLTLADSVKAGQLSPSPRLTSWVLRKLPYMRRATAIKDAFISAKVSEAIHHLLNHGADSARPRSALHSVLLRERDLATKQSRPPSYHSRAISDEFTGFTLAGHDTTATAVAWGLKYLADHPPTQTRLRAALHAALPLAARAPRRAPTYAELAAARVPYLDAVVAEVLRLANAIAFVVRVARRDTSVLGRRIPAGTDVFLMADGPGYLVPPLPLADGVRSPGARQHGAKAHLSGAWDDGDAAAFRPERWLVADAEGGEAFDALAGPSLAFGLGPRGCFGRRLAVVALRIQFAMTVWRFELLGYPARLGGYEAVQRFAREPARCYVRLAAAGG